MAQGSKTGGRKKGTPNKATAKREAEIAKSGKTPLQFLLDRMRNSKADMAERIECAKAAALFRWDRMTENLSERDVAAVDDFYLHRLGASERASVLRRLAA